METSLHSEAQVCASQPFLVSVKRHSFQSADLVVVNLSRHISEGGPALIFCSVILDSEGNASPCPGKYTIHLANSAVHYSEKQPLNALYHHLLYLM